MSKQVSNTATVATTTVPSDTEDGNLYDVYKYSTQVCIKEVKRLE